jgi:alpha-glucosidase (family GH31 glycosyl hydrolase)
MSESSCLETGTDALLGSVEKGNSSKIRFMLNELSLTVGETIYGLGERFTPLVKNGGSHSIWNQGEPRARLSNQYSPREEDTQLTFGTG